MRQRLRPMGVGDIIDETFRLYRANFLLFIAVVAVVEIPIQIIDLLVSLGLLNYTQPLANLHLTAGQTTLTPAQRDAVLRAGVAAIGFGVVTILVTLIGTTLMTAALALAISRRYLGQTITVGQAYSAALTRIGSLLLMILWVAVRLLAPFIILFGIAAGVPGLAPPSIIVAVFVGIPYLIYFGVAWILVTQVIMLEGERGTTASRRSRELISGYWWKALGVFIVTWLLIIILRLVADIPAGYIARAVGSASGSAGIQLTVATLLDIIIGVLTQPLVIIASTLLFYDLKIRKEGFDLEALARQADLTAPGAPPLTPSY